MKITKKHLLHTFDDTSFHDCGCDHCEGGEGADALENMHEHIQVLIDRGNEVDVYVVPRKVKK